MPIEKVIVLEDEMIVRKNLEQQLRKFRYDVAAVDTIEKARDYLSRDSFDLLIADVNLPDGDSTELLCELNERPEKPLVIMMSGMGTIDSAVNCMRNGAFDYLIKPFSIEQLEVTLKKAEKFTQLVKVNRYLNRDADEAAEGELLGNSEQMQKLRELIRRVARTEATVLIQGESGTGKELVSRALFAESPRADGPYIKVNCAAVPENLIESEFFGHEKGAFTGAMNKREGRFELAHGGTILLDEVSEVAPTVQAKLLRVLQERELERVGGSRTIKVDCRVLATTNRRLEESVERKEFRQDLFFRLNVVPIHLPALRERIGDVPFLADQFLKRFARKHGVRIQGFSNDATGALKAHSWPGNVRELQNVIERAVILGGDGDLIEPAHLGLGTPVEITTSTPSTITASAAAPESAAATEEDNQLSLADIEKRHILSVLASCNDNRTHAAEKLGISIRTLRNKLNEYKATEADQGIANE